MIRDSVEFPKGMVEEYRRFSIQSLERAVMVAADKASKRAQAEIRTAMRSSGLGSLGQALGQYSDLQKGQVHRRGGEAFSASGTVYIRTGSERSRGTIEAYTEGADIRPVKGAWLWIATDQIPRKAGRKRMTPALYNATGLDRRIGPLVMVRRANGYPMLVVNNVGVSTSGRGRSAKRLTRSGLSSGRQTEASIVAFIGIPFTARVSRVDVPAIMRKHAASVGDIVNSELQKGP